jgi:hypothetical protein
LGFVFTNETVDAVQLARWKAKVIRDPHRCQPELRGLAFSRDMDVHWLVAIAGKEEEPVRAAPQNGRAHPPILASFHREPAYPESGGQSRSLGRVNTQGVFAMFANDHHSDGHVGVWLPAPLDLQEALIEEDPSVSYRPPYVGSSGWIGIDLPRIHDDALAGHIREAYRLIVAKKKRKKRA